MEFNTMAHATGNVVAGSPSYCPVAAAKELASEDRPSGYAFQSLKCTTNKAAGDHPHRRAGTDIFEIAHFKYVWLLQLQKSAVDKGSPACGLRCYTARRGGVAGPSARTGGICPATATLFLTLIKKSRFMESLSKRHGLL